MTLNGDIIARHVSVAERLVDLDSELARDSAATIYQLLEAVTELEQAKAAAFNVLLHHGLYEEFMDVLHSDNYYDSDEYETIESEVK